MARSGCRTGTSETSGSDGQISRQLAATIFLICRGENLNLIESPTSEELCTLGKAKSHVGINSDMWHCLWCSPGAGTRCRSKGHIAWPTTWLHIGCTLVAHLSSFSRFIFWILFGLGQPGVPWNLRSGKLPQLGPARSKGLPCDAHVSLLPRQLTALCQSPKRQGVGRANHYHQNQETRQRNFLEAMMFHAVTPWRQSKTCENKNSSSSGNYLKQSLSECELTLWATVVDRDNRAWLGVESLGHGCIQTWPQCSLMTSVNDASLQTSRPTNGSTTWDKNRLKSSDQLLASSMEVKEIQLRWYCSSGWKMCLKLQLCACEEATGQQRDAHIRSWPGVAVYVPDSKPGQYHGQTWSENKCMVRLTIF